MNLNHRFHLIIALSLVVIALALAISPSFSVLSDSNGLNPNSWALTEEMTWPRDLQGLHEGDAVSVTLITGDVIELTVSEEGGVIPAVGERNTEKYQILKSPNGSYVIPNQEGLSKLDVELFNVEYLVRQGYHELATLPVIVTLNDGQNIDGIAQLIQDGGGEVSSVSSHLSMITARLPYQVIENTSQSLLRSGSVRKVWLDSVARATLDQSIPIIGASDVWDMGFRGAGVEIAILDTGIDQTHPDLDDIDDDPLTDDAKVVHAVDFTTDGTASDLVGHGTHVAGIAAGTGQVSIGQNPRVDRTI